MLTNIDAYLGPHNNLISLAGLASRRASGLAKREVQLSRDDYSAAQAIANERAGMYRDLAYLLDSTVKGQVERIEAHVLAYPLGGDTP